MRAAVTRRQSNRGRPGDWRSPDDRRGPADRGITLIELMVAVMVLSIGLVAILRSVDHSRRVMGGEVARLLARQVTLNRAEELRLYGLAAGRQLPSDVPMGPYNWQIELQEKATAGGFVEVTILARAPDLPGALLVAYVSEAPLQ